MKKTSKIVIGILVLFTGTMLFLPGCVSAPEITTTQGVANSIEEAHPDRIEKTVIGMNVNDFKIIWPEAIRSGVSSDGEIYEFIYTNAVKGMYGITYTNFKIYTYFYFTNNRLTKYESSRRNALGQ